MAYIDIINNNISPAINKSDPVYQAIFGVEDFVPESTIVDSSDFNCGAVCNELEFVQLSADYLSEDAISIDGAEGDDLQYLVTQLVDLRKRGSGESDSIYRKRFKFLVVANAYENRITKWAILNALYEFVPKENVQLLEFFDDGQELYFEIRIDSFSVKSDVLTLNDSHEGFLDHSYIGGSGLGALTPYLASLADRIKAAGVDVGIKYIEQGTVELVAGVVIGSRQQYVAGDTIVFATRTITKTADTVVTT